MADKRMNAIKRAMNIPVDEEVEKASEAAGEAYDGLDKPPEPELEETPEDTGEAVEEATKVPFEDGTYSSNSSDPYTYEVRDGKMRVASGPGIPEGGIDAGGYYGKHILRQLEDGTLQRTVDEVQDQMVPQETPADEPDVDPMKGPPSGEIAGGTIGAHQTPGAADEGADYARKIKAMRRGEY